MGVLISASHERDMRLTGLGAGADDFLNKPVDADELYTRVRSLIRLKRLTDDLESAESLFLTLGRIIEARDMAEKALEVAKTTNPEQVPQVRWRLEELRERAKQAVK